MSALTTWLHRRWRSLHKRVQWARPVGWRALSAVLVLVTAGAGPVLAELPLSADAIPRRTAAVTEVVAGILTYARWPDAPETFQLCVIGPTEYADALLQEGNPASQWSSTVLRVTIDDPQLATRCQALYVGVLSKTERYRLLDQLQASAVLTISERNTSCAIGSMFCLNIGADKVTFEVNLDAVARSEVKVHPHVLRLGRVVEP